jgi:hypothetical protein
MNWHIIQLPDGTPSLQPIKVLRLQILTGHQANANPVKYRDPSGHDVGCPGGNASDCAFKPEEAQSPTEIVDNVEDDEYGTQGRLVDTWFEAHPGYDPYQDPNLWVSVKTDTGYIPNVKGEYAWSVLYPYIWWRAGRPREGDLPAKQAMQQATDWADNGGSVLGPAAFGGVFSGGRYKDLARGPGIEIHHMPAKSVSPLSEGDGPAIQMETGDHRITGSWGRSRDAIEYRSLQKSLIDQGRFDDAIQMDIDDVQQNFGSKYDAAILKMIDSLEK